MQFGVHTYKLFKVICLVGVYGLNNVVICRLIWKDVGLLSIGKRLDAQTANRSALLAVGLHGNRHFEWVVWMSLTWQEWKPWGRSDSHGHEDVAILELRVWVFGAHLARGLGILELETNFAFIVECLEEIQDVDGVEADHDWVTGVRRIDGVFALSRLIGVGADFEFVSFKAHADRSGALIGELSDTLDGGGELTAANNGKLGVVARHDCLEVGELAGELARAEGAMAYAEKESVLVIREVDFFSLS